MRNTLIWAGLALAVGVPIVVAASSPLLAWRDPVYIVAGFAGIAAMVLLLVQPLLAAGYLPGLSVIKARRMHRFIGAALVLTVVVHVGGLWITSPPDMIDALLFVSPTPFSAWGVIAMWTIFAAALLAAFRRRFGIGVRQWRWLHTGLAAITIGGSVAHAVLIDGTMGTMSKGILCALVVVVFVKTLHDLGSWRLKKQLQR